MALNRQEVFQLINNERDYQDHTFDPNQVLDSGLTRAQRDSEVLPHLVLLKSYIDDAMYCWTFSHRRGYASGSLPALQQVAKIAAIAVRAIERMPLSEQLLTKGLR